MTTSDAAEMVGGSSQLAGGRRLQALMTFDGLSAGCAGTGGLAGHGCKACVSSAPSCTTPALPHPEKTEYTETFTGTVGNRAPANAARAAQARPRVESTPGFPQSLIVKRI